MNTQAFAPIKSAVPDTRAPSTHAVASLLEPAPVQPDYAGMDDATEWAAANFARIDRMSDDQIEEALAEQSEAASKEELEDVQHDMRVEWQRAIDGQHALSTPKLPTVDTGKLVMVPVTELVGTLMDMQWSVSLLAEALRTGDTTKLHLHLRTMWVDGYSEELANIGWHA